MQQTITTTKFRVTIVGAGIAGLCAAIGLAKQGQHVTILESAHELTPIGIGIHIPTNATLVLKHFGVLERMRQDAIYPTGFVFRRWADSSVLAEAPAPQQAESGLPYWSMRRSDYQRHLYEAAIAAGCRLRLSARVETLDEDTPSVTLATGEIITSDVIIVANGVKSKIRSAIIPEHHVNINLSSQSAYRAYVHQSDLQGDPLVAPFFQKVTTNIWTGYARHVIVYPCGGDMYTLGATHPSEDTEAMEWTSPASIEMAQRDFQDFDSVVARILSFAKDVKKWRLAEVPRLPTWVSKSGKVVLVGDAAHGMLQFVAQGAAMATEDAGALVECLEWAKTLDDIPAALGAFERSRKWRCEIVQAQARRNGEMIHMPDGQEQESRDRLLAGLPQYGIWNADKGPLLDANFRNFLYNHDVIEHTRKILASIKR